MKPIKSTSSVHYGMQMNLIFKHFGVSNNGEPKDNEILSWVAKKVVALRLNPQPRMETACTCFDEESAQNKEKKKKKKNKEKKRRRIDPHPLLTKLIRSVKRLESRVCRSPLSKLDKVKETLEEALDKKIVSSPTVEASSLESEISQQIKKTTEKESPEKTRNLEKHTEDDFEDVQNEVEKEESPLHKKDVSKEDPLEEPLNYGSYHVDSKHHYKEEQKDEEDHYEPQKKEERAQKEEVINYILSDIWCQLLFYFHAFCCQDSRLDTNFSFQKYNCSIK